ncbi:MAG: Gfo/Idh/MocA family oxidoreductase [Candidatus Omnitrophica bacterium]|nr:Gfo/Idh/MocA family oxidoreductase [Candidatus Omnitrophota bacterium]
MPKDKKKVIIFGLGSIGSRHLGLLRQYFDFQIYAYRSKKRPPKALGHIKELYAWEEVDEIRPDIAFITNPTFLHIDTALKCARSGMKLFIEKPIGHSSSGFGSLLKEVRRKKLVTYVAYNLRFHPVIRWLKDYLGSSQIYHASVYNSSDIRAWRPGKDHRSSYSGKKSEGGGVILDLSHEFDYIGYLFAGIRSIKGRAARLSGFTTDAEDCLDAIIDTQAARVNLHINIFSRSRERWIRIDSCKGNIYADLINSRIEGVGPRGRFAKSFSGGVPLTYKLQLDYFFRNINNPAMMNNLFEAEALFRKLIKFRGQEYENLRNNRR